MNLRKLLCGLLALCLLLTMAPAALMEEAPVEEVVVELGGEIEAPEEALVEGEAVAADELMTYDADETTTLEDNMEMTIDKTDTVTLETGAEISAINWSYSKTAAVTGKGTTTLTIEPKKTGSGKIVVWLKEKDINGKDKYTINLKITDKNAPACVKIFMDGTLVESTEEIELGEYSETGVYLEAGLFTEANKDSEDIEDAEDDYAILWTFTNKSKIQEDKQSATEVKVTPKAEAKVKVTATAKGTNKKASFTLNIVDSYKPKSIKLYADKYKENKAFNTSSNTWTVEDFAALADVDVTDEEATPYTTLVELRAEVDPDSVQPITWSVDNKKIADLAQPKSKDMVNWLVAKKVGKVKVTAKTYNGKSASVTITILDINDPAKVAIGICNVTADETLGTRDFDTSSLAYEDHDPTEIVELYDLNAKDKVVKATYVLNATVSNGKGEALDYTKLTWKSSKSAVAAVKANRDGTANLTLKKTGTTVITVTTKNGKKDSFTLKVVDHRSPTAIYFVDDDGVTIKSFKMKAGEGAYLNPVFVAVDDPAFEQCTFKSHHTSIATVNSNGYVYAIRKGNVKIDAVANNGKKATITVKISK